MSLVTNECIMDVDSNKPPPNHKEVMETANNRARDLQHLVTATVEKFKTLGCFQ